MRVGRNRRFGQAGYLWALAATAVGLGTTERGHHIPKSVADGSPPLQGSPTSSLSHDLTGFSAPQVRWPGVLGCVRWTWCGGLGPGRRTRCRSYGSTGGRRAAHAFAGVRVEHVLLGLADAQVARLA